MERLLTRRLVENLGAFSADGAPVTSVYLGLEPSREYRRAALVHLKDIVSNNWDKVMDGRSRGEKTMIEKDIDAFTNFIEKMPRVEVQGLAMYSCADKGFFEQVGVAVPFRQMIVADRPAVAPLINALDNYRRIAVCLVDRRSARLYEYFMGRIEEIEVFSDDVPGRVRVSGFGARVANIQGSSGLRGRVKTAGWAGYRDAKNARHIQQHEMAHLKNVADVLFRAVPPARLRLALPRREKRDSRGDGARPPHIRPRAAQGLPRC